MKKFIIDRAENFIALGISAVFLGYAVYRVVNIPKINLFEIVYTVTAVTIAVAAAMMIILPRRFKQNLLLMAAAIAVSVVAAWFMLPLAGIEPKSVIHQTVNTFRSELGSPEIVLKSRKGSDNRTVAEVLEALRANGIEAYRSPSLRSLIESADTDLIPLLPLGGISRATTVNCNEGDQRQFPVLQSDRYGFNNEDTVYAQKNDRILLLGDSFIYGQCVHQEQTVAGHLRRNGYAAISLGVGGNGPLFDLASLREYGSRLRPKTVVWFYTVGNDLIDLRDHEIRSKILINYFDPQFSQNLAGKQNVVDKTWKTIWNNPSHWRPIINAHGVSADAYRKGGKEEAAEVHRRLLSVLGPRASNIGSVKKTEDVVKIIGQIFRTAKQDVESWGGTLYFAPIWGASYYRLGRLPPHIDAVMAEAKAAKLPFIDIDAAIKRSGDHDLFFPVTKDIPHHNSNGYALFADAIADVLAPKSGLLVLEATFGENCKDAKLTYPAVNIVRPGNATQAVSGICDGRAKCSFGIGNNLVGSDPAGGCVKDFVATWMCIGSKRKGSLYVDKSTTGSSKVHLFCEDGVPRHDISVRKSSAHEVFTGALSGKAVRQIEAQYKSYVGIENAVAGEGSPSRAETASILGNSIAPSGSDRVFRIAIAAPAFAARDSEFVVGIFLANSSRAVAHQRLLLKKGITNTANVEYFFQYDGTAPVAVDIRIGVGSGGKVFLNGDDKSQSSTVWNPRLVIEEYKKE